MEGPSFNEAVSSQSFDWAATAVSKTYIILFFIFCGIVAYLDAPTLGWWWVVVLVGGMFAASVLVAAPVTALKVLLATKADISPLTAAGRVFYRVVDVGGYVALWFATRYALNAIGS